MSLHVEREGQGPDLVLLHGWGLHSGAFDEVRPRLARRFTVHAVDLPGHGRSADVHFESFAGAAAALGNLVPADAILCGWSLGGLLAQRIAAGNTQLRGLALIATTPCFVVRPGWAHAMKPETLEAFARGLQADREKTLRDFVHLNALHGAHGRDAVRALSKRLAAHGAPSAAALEASLGWLRDTDLRETASAITAPTLVLHGTRDALAPVEAGRWLAATIPGARGIEFTDAAHLPFFTHPEAFAEALESLLG